MNTKISQGMVLVASNSNSTVESWVQDGSFRSVEDECFLARTRRNDDEF